ncbi:hypothetical protein HRW18_16040 [Streptomyces lunaelactis]|uniref:hypothetical protein n=1 Tax=Streptomyces lunaelactis TaxID=1535768 RepID=UPI00158455B9|nr:hypothetical protein [Streptomyces lunaelactis]NUK09487.1 hypothetical protein [Streptomyces lunaelactis]NUK73364.1 hypothetical protein [Streptomyces lunaelactis]NUL10929.1 hypothetical protein [Streptomyces lunaelactis]NUL24521.1 hypothetical protein [Streptomyces lunaelactis]
MKDKSLANLRITAGPVETLYLNERRVEDRFISHLNAIESRTRTELREGGGEVGMAVVKLGGKRSTEQSTTYTLDKPIAQALLLHEALAQNGSLRRSPNDPHPGDYVQFAGRAFLSHPTRSPGDVPLPTHTAAYPALEAERARQESWQQALGSPDPTMWLLVLDDDSKFSAAVLASRWLNADAITSYVHTRWQAFGVVEGVIDSVPLLSALHITWVHG